MRTVQQKNASGDSSDYLGGLSKKTFTSYCSVYNTLRQWVLYVRVRVRVNKSAYVGQYECCYVLFFVESEVLSLWTIPLRFEQSFLSQFIKQIFCNAINFKTNWNKIKWDSNLLSLYAQSFFFIKIRGKKSWIRNAIFLVLFSTKTS